MATRDCDLLVIGGGPAGLSAAINGASEGLHVRLLDNGLTLGGQARESSAVENYPGFPDGVTGPDLMSRCVAQAVKFQTDLISPVTAYNLERDGKALICETDDYELHSARAVLLAFGLQYRRLQAENISQFTGRGVYYGVPTGKAFKRGTPMIVVGGANSAGQAALSLANQGFPVKMLIRKKLDIQMSTYLVDRILTHPQIEVCEGCVVKGCYSTHKAPGVLAVINYDDNGKDRAADAGAMFIFIGAVPRTRWLVGTITLDDRQYVRTWKPGDDCDPNCALPFATSMPGVFAAGDVRSGSTKRIAAAIGEGSAALAMIHKYMAKGD